MSSQSLKLLVGGSLFLLATPFVAFGQTASTSLQDEMEVCASREYPADRNRCYHRLAVENKDPDLCESIVYRRIRDDCLAGLGNYQLKALNRPYAGVLAVAVLALGLYAAHRMRRFSLAIGLISGGLVGAIALLNVRQAFYILLPTFVPGQFIFNLIGIEGSFITDLPANYLPFGIANSLLYALLFWLAFSRNRRKTKWVLFVLVLLASLGVSVAWSALWGAFGTF